MYGDNWEAWQWLIVLVTFIGAILFYAGVDDGENGSPPKL